MQLKKKVTDEMNRRGAVAAIGAGLATLTGALESHAEDERKLGQIGQVSAPIDELKFLFKKRTGRNLDIAIFGEVAAAVHWWLDEKHDGYVGFWNGLKDKNSVGQEVWGIIALRVG